MVGKWTTFHLLQIEQTSAPTQIPWDTPFGIADDGDSIPVDHTPFQYASYSTLWNVPINIS